MGAAATTAANIRSFSGYTGQTMQGGRYAAYGEFFGDQPGTITIDGKPLPVDVWKDSTIRGPLAFESIPPGPATVNINGATFETTITE